MVQAVLAYLFTEFSGAGIGAQKHEVTALSYVFIEVLQQVRNPFKITNDSLKYKVWMKIQLHMQKLSSNDGTNRMFLKKIFKFFSKGFSIESNHLSMIEHLNTYCTPDFSWKTSSYRPFTSRCLHPHRFAVRSETHRQDFKNVRFLSNVLIARRPHH